MAGLAERLRASLGDAGPPAGLTAAAQALWWLARGGLRTGPDWEKAHEICQAHEGERDHDLVHALAHMIEGDRWNSDYWYGQAGRARVSDDLPEEWEAVAGAIAAT